MNVNDSEIFLLCLAVVSIFLIWRAISQKKKKKAPVKKVPPKQQQRPSFRTTEPHDCIPPKGARIGVVVGTIMSTVNADGQSTLKALHESLLWSRKNLFEKEAEAPVTKIIEKLRPSIERFVWEYHT